jgi:hypothetical protein
VFTPLDCAYVKNRFVRVASIVKQGSVEMCAGYLKNELLIRDISLVLVYLHRDIDFEQDPNTIKRI